MAECEIRFIKSFCYSEISPRQDFLTTGPAHQCWNALLLSLSFFARCMRPPFSEVFRRKLSGKSARRVSRGCAVNRTTAGALHFSIQRSVGQAPSVLLLQAAPAAGPNPSPVPWGRDSKHPQGTGAPPCVSPVSSWPCCLVAL